GCGPAAGTVAAAGGVWAPPHARTVATSGGADRVYHPSPDVGGAGRRGAGTSADRASGGALGPGAGGWGRPGPHRLGAAHWGDAGGAGARARTGRTRHDSGIHAGGTPRRGLVRSAGVSATTAGICSGRSQGAALLTGHP